MNEFEKATRTFLNGADFLGDADLPLATALRETAKELDGSGVNAALINQYRLLYQTLSAKGQAGTEEVDPLEELLS